MCLDRYSGSFWRALLFGALLFSARTIWGQEQPALGMPSPWLPSTRTAPSSEMPPTDPWASFDSLWSSLKTELTESDADYLRLSQSLDALLIEVQGLKSSSTESTRLWQESEAARMTEREAAIEREAGIVERLWAAERSRAVWRTGALIGISAAALEVVIIAIMIIGG